MAYLYLKLAILPNMTVMVPGCEPTSAITSPGLLRNFNCPHPTAKVSDILDAIPGSKIIWIPDYGARDRFLELPPIDMSCPCTTHPDYYAIIRSLASGEDVVEEKFDYCNVNDMGFCPSPDFKLTPPPEASPYYEEGILPSF